MAWCCANCFNDQEILSSLISEGIDDCNFCGSTQVEIFDTKDLADNFELLLSRYERINDQNSTTSIASVLQQDWDLFAKDMDIATMDRIFSSSDINHKNDNITIRSRIERHSGDQQWTKFCNSIVLHNRFFPTLEIPMADVKSFMQYLIISIDPSVPLYRARINSNKESRWGAIDMGAPPSGKAKGGRANPTHLPYLYVATSPETAIAEIRPHKGSLVSVSRATLQSSQQIIDLSKLDTHLSPFLVGDDRLTELFLLRPFLDTLPKKYCTPIQPEDESINYLPTQYLCEFIKSMDYDGVKYHSSLHDSGDNIAFFSVDCCTFEAPSVHKVDQIQVSFSIA